MNSTDENEGRNTRRRGLPMMGIALVALGVLLLLQTTDVIPWTVWFELWRFWPALLIAVGVNMFVGRRAPWVAAALVALIFAGSLGGAYALNRTTAGDLAERYVATLAGAERVDINIKFGAGSLVIDSLPEGSPDLIDANYFGRRGKTDIKRSGNTAIIDVTMDGQNFLRNFSGVRWELGLSTVPQITLDLDGGAANMDVDLRGLRVTDLNVDIGAADIRIVLPETGTVKADIRGGAADINIIIPAGVAARITNNSGLSSVDIDTSRFPKFGRVYESLNFDQAENRVILHISVGAADVTVR